MYLGLILVRTNYSYLLKVSVIKCALVHYSFGGLRVHQQPLITLNGRSYHALRSLVLRAKVDLVGFEPTHAVSFTVALSLSYKSRVFCSLHSYKGFWSGSASRPESPIVLCLSLFIVLWCGRTEARYTSHDWTGNRLLNNNLSNLLKMILSSELPILDTLKHTKAVAIEICHLFSVLERSCAIRS